MKFRVVLGCCCCFLSTEETVAYKHFLISLFFIEVLFTIPCTQLSPVFLGPLCFLFMLLTPFPRRHPPPPTLPPSLPPPPFFCFFPFSFSRFIHLCSVFISWLISYFFITSPSHPSPSFTRHSPSPPPPGILPKPPFRYLSTPTPTPSGKCRFNRFEIQKQKQTFYKYFAFQFSSQPYCQTDVHQLRGD